MNDGIKRLYRVPDDGRLAGVCAGLGKYFKIDPVAMRLLWVAATFATAVVPAVLLYLVAWAIMPEEPRPVAYTAPAPPAPATNTEQQPT